MTRWLIVGLGNPGKQYESTRHNVGFMAVDALAANFQFSSTGWRTKFNAEISKGLMGDQKVILAKPQTFMNNSGSTVKSLYTKYRIQSGRQLAVLHHRPHDPEVPRGRTQASTDDAHYPKRGCPAHLRKTAKDEHPCCFRASVCHAKNYLICRENIILTPTPGRCRDPANHPSPSALYPRFPQVFHSR